VNWIVAALCQVWGREIGALGFFDAMNKSRRESILRPPPRATSRLSSEGKSCWRTWVGRNCRSKKWCKPSIPTCAPTRRYMRRKRLCRFGAGHPFDRASTCLSGASRGNVWSGITFRGQGVKIQQDSTVNRPVALPRPTRTLAGTCGGHDGRASGDLWRDAVDLTIRQ